MARSQALAFGELLGGGVLLTAAIKGQPIREVLAGKASPIRPLVSDSPTGQQPASGAGIGGGVLASIGGKIGKWAKLADTADRPGVRTHRPVLAFTAKIAQMTGKPLTIGTGTNHSKFTTSGSISDHWDGWAADIEAYGGELVQLGQAALIAAGMNPREARQKHGGLFDVGGWQIIFNTQIGGDHTNHLHVGRRH